MWGFSDPSAALKQDARTAGVVDKPCPMRSTPAYIVISECMAKSVRDSTKSNPKMGRPKTTGPGEPQIVRMHDQPLDAIDDWIAAQGEKSSRPGAIRRLVAVGLEVRARWLLESVAVRRSPGPVALSLRGRSACGWDRCGLAA